MKNFRTKYLLFFLFFFYISKIFLFILVMKKVFVPNEIGSEGFDIIEFTRLHLVTIHVMYLIQTFSSFLELILVIVSSKFKIIEINNKYLYTYTFVFVSFSFLMYILYMQYLPLY